MNERLVQLSKTIAYVLRHRPDTIGIEIDPAGWVDVGDLITALQQAGHTISERDLSVIVAAVDKLRYQLADGRIRATHGHSFPIDLGLAATTPPSKLFHGTVARFIPTIIRDGLRSQQRQHVHLTTDRTSAAEIGSRRGTPVVLSIAARSMHDDGHVFYLTPGGVWLTTEVPPRYLTDPPSIESQAPHYQDERQ